MGWSKKLDFKTQAALIAVITGLAIGSLGLLGWQALQSVKKAEGQWTEFSRRAQEANRHLDQIVLEFGYGGLIHNFKNYILRQDDIYLSRVEQSRDKIASTLQGIDAHTISNEERRHLKIVSNTLAQYTHILKIAEDGFARGLTPHQVDLLVIVDDAPALAALEQLGTLFLNRSTIARERNQAALVSASSAIKALFILVPITLLLGVALIMFLRRITDANKYITEVNHELDSLMNSAPDAILSVLDDGSIVRANKSAEELFAYTNDELQRLNVSDLIPMGLREGHQHLMEKRFSNEAPRHFSASKGTFALSGTGREFPVEISLSFVTKGEQQISIAIIRDMNERYKAEIALHAAHADLKKRVEQRTEVLLKTNAELERQIAQRMMAEDQLLQSSKMVAIGEMSSDIAHDLSQPMNIIRMNVEAEMLKISRGKSDLESANEILSRVEAQIIRMTEIVDKMRALSDSLAQGTVPAANAAPQPQPDAKQASAPPVGISGRVKILVVDDEEVAAQSLSEFLEDMGHLVYTAFNGQEAINIFDSDPADMVITDIRMPVMNGIELIRQLRERNVEIPIIAMTGHSPVGVETEIQYGDATEVWKKPLSLKEIAARLEALCNPTDTSHPDSAKPTA